MRQFSGVHWDTLNVMVEDIDRIEGVRGPGGAVWGANAVNGVINIITKSSAETQGASVRAGFGENDRRGLAAGCGGTTGAWTDRSATVPCSTSARSTTGRWPLSRKRSLTRVFSRLETTRRSRPAAA